MLHARYAGRGIIFSVPLFSGNGYFFAPFDKSSKHCVIPGPRIDVQ